jgi:hypothetical protein
MNVAPTAKQFTETTGYIEVMQVRDFGGLKTTDLCGFSQLLTLLP